MADKVVKTYTQDGQEVYVVWTDNGDGTFSPPGAGSGGGGVDSDGNALPSDFLVTSIEESEGLWIITGSGTGGTWTLDISEVDGITTFGANGDGKWVKQ